MTGRTILRMVQQGLVEPARRPPDGTYWFSADQAAQVQAVNEDGSRRGRKTAMVFEALQKGTAAVQVAIDLELAPEEVRGFVNAFASLNGGTFLSAEGVRVLVDLGLVDVEPGSNAPSENLVVKIVQAAAAGLKCVCEQRRATMCAHCARSHLQVERKHAEAALAAVQERLGRAHASEMAEMEGLLRKVTVERDLALARAGAPPGPVVSAPIPSPVEAPPLQIAQEMDDVGALFQAIAASQAAPKRRGRPPKHANGSAR